MELHRLALAFTRHKLFKNSIIYTLSGGIAVAIPFFLLPVFTRYLTPEEYGVTATFRVVLALMAVFVGMNTIGAVAVNFFKLNKQDLREYVGNIMLVLAASFAVTLFVVYALRSFFSSIINFPQQWLVFAVIIAFCQFIFTLIVTLFQVEQKPMHYGIFQITRTILNVGFSLLFVVGFGWGWQGVLSGIFIASIFSALLAIFFIFRLGYIRFSFNRSYIRDALFFSIPLIPHAIGGWIMFGIDRFFINSMVNVASTGVYAVGYQLGYIIGLLTYSFNQAWSPFLYEKLKEDKYSTKVLIVKFTYLYGLMLALSVLVLTLVSPFFLKFFVGKNFHSAYKYVGWIASGYAAVGMYYMVCNYIFYVKRTYLLALVTFISAAVNVSLTYLLIKRNGVIGAAQATAISFFVYLILTWILSSRAYKMPWVFWRRREPL